MTVRKYRASVCKPDKDRYRGALAADFTGIRFLTAGAGIVTAFFTGFRIQWFAVPFRIIEMFVGCLEKLEFLLKSKAGEDFNRRNTLSILRIKI